MHVDHVTMCVWDHVTMCVYADAVLSTIPKQNGMASPLAEMEWWLYRDDPHIPCCEADETASCALSRLS